MPQQVIAGRYELLEEISHGGMGDVWRGYDAVLDRPVAVKLIRPQAVTSPQMADELAKRFRREARITARIQHPGVPQVYDAVLDDTHERLFLVMELVEGIPLSAYVDPARPLPVSWAVAVAAQVATVLSHAHEVPVIHRDLKPGNVLVARDGTVKVLDFGIAAILRTDATKLTATGSPIGTSQYMAPEQVRGGRVTPQTDLYALGCVLHELLSGRALFQADSEFALMYQHVSAAPPRSGTRAPRSRPRWRNSSCTCCARPRRRGPPTSRRCTSGCGPSSRRPARNRRPARAARPERRTRPGCSATRTRPAPAPGPWPPKRLPGRRPPHPYPYRTDSGRTSRRRTRTPTPFWKRSGSRRPRRC